MTNRLLVEITADGRASLLVGGSHPEIVGGPVDVAWPLDEQALEDLRWYLEDFVRAPYGPLADRGERIGAALPEWGGKVFETLFGSGPARDALVSMRGHGRLELVIRSAQARWLGLPWELLTDPARPAPLALDGIGIDRSLPSAQLGSVFEAGGERLRVLMVIARPSGEDDVGYQMVARPLLQRLDAVRGQVDLVVLRPPTLERLHEVLTREGPFHIVHFDGHGVLGRSGAGLGPAMYGTQAQGVLVFEGSAGGPDYVEAGRVAQVLASGRVPVVVLNACQSGAMPGEIEAGVATRLLQGGACSVVAMAYSVFAVAAAEFMTDFYERLFAGGSVSEAVTAGRLRLARNNRRPSPKGRLPLSDWLVPVHYVRRETRFPDLKAGTARQPAPEDEDLEPIGVFVGRDALFYRLEAAARAQRVIVLHGSGGTGKSELAKAFGRWWRDSGGAEAVVWHSCAPGTAVSGLDSLVTTIALQFGLLEPEQREQEVARLLRQHRVLIILDNFESWVTMPDPGTATPPLSEHEQERLRKFFGRITTGTVLITSRTPESWLHDTVRRIEVPGLTRDEAVLYADELLQGFPAAQRRRALPAFAELMDWLDGHPLSMRLILPRLDTTDPDALLTGLRGLATLPNTDQLDACVKYSFAHLSSTTAELLTAVSLFHGVADADVLALWSSQPEVPPRFAGHDEETWTRILDEAAGVGLLTPIGAGMFRLHPALPSFLMSQWRAMCLSTFDSEHADGRHTMRTAYADFSDWLVEQIVGGNAPLAVALIAAQRHTMGVMLADALEHHEWSEAESVLRGLAEYWKRAGLHSEADKWTDRVHHALDPTGTAAPALDTPAGSLWLYSAHAQANRRHAGGQLDQADHTYRQILDMLNAQPESPTRQSRLANIYHQLGMTAQERGDHDAADARYHRSIAIKDQLGNQQGLANTYHQLGNTAHERGDYDAADAWYHRSLAINERLRNEQGLANTYHQLGMSAQGRGDYDAADTWYHRSLDIEKLLGNLPGLAISYHQLGNTAFLRGDYDTANTWYHRSLAIEEQLGNRSSLASSYGQLGLLAEQSGDLRQALAWTIRAITVLEKLPTSGPGPYHLKRLTGALGIGVAEAVWVETMKQAMPQVIREYLTTEGQ